MEFNKAMLSPIDYLIQFQNICVDWDDMGIIVNGENLNHLRFADDIVLISDSIDNARTTLERRKKM